MQIDVREFASRLKQELDDIIHDILKIPDSMFQECGLSGFGVVMYDGSGDEHKVAAEEEKNRFERLCQAAPLAPKDAILYVSLAYATISACFDERTPYAGDEHVMRALMTASMSKGIAIGLLLTDPKTKEAERKILLSMAGRKGAESRHSKTTQLKSWALEQAKDMRGDDAGIARRLAQKMPADLVDASKNPDRLIYDALRANRKGTRG